MRLAEAYRVLPREHSTHPRSGPKLRSTGLMSRGPRPSTRSDCLSASSVKSRSGKEGDDGRIPLFFLEMNGGEEREDGKYRSRDSYSNSPSL